MKKGKKLKIFLIVLAVIAVLVAGVVVWQWHNIKAVFYFLNYSQEDLDEMYRSNQKELDEALGKFGAVKPRDLNEREKKALNNNVITEEEAVEISLGNVTLEELIKSKKEETKVTETESGNTTKEGNTVTEKTTESTKVTEKKEEAKNTDNISSLIAQLYVLKSSYIARLDGLEAEGMAEHSRTPKEQRTAAWRGNMISKYTARISAWEGECDAAVEGIISQIRQELNKTGGDTSIIQTIRSTYENEKQIKKASYLNKYMK